MRNIVFLTIAVFILCFALIVNAQVSITLWHSYRGREKEAIKKVAENFNAKKNENGIKLTWNPPTSQSNEDTIQHFVIYRSKSLPIDLSNGINIYAIVTGDQYQYVEESKKIESGCYYTITAIDNAENESEPVQEIKLK